MRRGLPLFLCIIFVLSLTTACAKTETQLSAAELLDLGEKYLLEMNCEQAVVQFKKLIKIEPKNPRGYTGAAEAYRGLGDIDKAIEILKQGLEQLPDNEEIRGFLNDFSVIASGDSPAISSEDSSVIAERIFSSPDFVRPEELTIFGVPFYEAQYEWVLSTAAQSYVVRTAGGGGEDSHRIIPLETMADDSFFGWQHGMSVMSTTGRQKGDNTPLEAVFYGMADALLFDETNHSSYRGYARMDIPPEVRSLMLDDTRETVLTKLGIEEEDQQYILPYANVGLSVELSLMRRSDLELRYEDLFYRLETDRLLHDEDYAFIYDIQWGQHELREDPRPYIRSYIRLNISFDSEGLLKRLYMEQD